MTRAPEPRPSAAPEPSADPWVLPESLTTETTGRGPRFSDDIWDFRPFAPRSNGYLRLDFTELPDEIADLRERFTPEELRKVAEAYLKVASDLYTSLAERGEETVERIRRTPAIEEGLERANAAANDVVDLTEQALGTVASQTRAVGERAAALAGVASDKVRESAEEFADEIDEAGEDAKEAATSASDNSSGQAGRGESKTLGLDRSPIKKAAPAKKATPAPAAKKTAAPAKKAPAKKTTR